jgi:hypothetical protein
VASIGTFIYDAGGNLNMVGAPLATGNVVVSEGTTANLDFDLTGAAGRIVGALTVNAAPAIGHLSRINPTTFDVFVSVTAGRFSQILAPGSYTTTFFVPGEREQFDVGSVSFTVVAGQTTFLNGGVGQDVLPGNNNSFHIGGGRLAPGGLTITVNGETITSGTLWVEEGTLDGQPPPPSGYRFVGVNYFWDINTIPHPLFECSPPGSPCIEVCINYGLLSVPNEATVGLVHDDGVTTCPDAGGGTTRWCNITTDRSASANWVCGNTSSLSPFALVAAIDEVGPVFENVPETIVAYATSTAGATVVYTPPTATDALDGGRPVTCAPASGTAFPVGKTTVTCTASDTIGNPGEAAFTVWVQYQAPADASFFLKPIRPDGSSRFRLGRAVPVKFQLTGASAGITNLVARLTVTRISDAVRGTVDCEGDEDGEDTDMLFKYRKGKGIYGYRWKTRGESQGTYRLRADLGDGVTHEVNVSLKMPL